MHGFESIMLKDDKGEPAPVYSIASGLDYPSVGPEHAFLRDLGRVQYDTVSDEEAMDAFFKLSRTEGIIPAIELSLIHISGLQAGYHDHEHCYSMHHRCCFIQSDQCG